MRVHDRLVARHHELAAAGQTALKACRWGWFFAEPVEDRINKGRNQSASTVLEGASLVPKGWYPGINSNGASQSGRNPRAGIQTGRGPQPQPTANPQLRWPPDCHRRSYN